MLPNETPIESWKEIGAYLQRDATTARRWEREEGLPVHRHSHKSRSSVYAYASEIDAWRVSRKAAPEPEEAPVSRPLWRVPAFAVTILACLIMVGNGIRPASAEQGRPMATRRLVTKAEVGYDNLSPDGKWFGGTDWNKGDLVLASVSKGEIRRLVPAHFDKEPESWGEAPVLSPDQKQVAYLWFDDGDPKASGGQLRVMPNEPGAKSRLLFGKPGEYKNTYPFAWSPDGKRILASLDKRDRNQNAAGAPHRGRTGFEIAWISAADNSVQVIKTLEPWRTSGNEVLLSLSPDGRYIAYSALIRQGAPETCICVLSANGTNETELVQADINEGPVWSSDGAHILFTSNRSGSFGLWSVPVRDGKRAGLPVLLKPDTGRIRSLGMTRSGTYYYNYRGTLNQIFVADMDPATGKARGPAVSVTDSFVGVAPAWSRDGKWLAFKRQRTGASGYELILHSMESGSERTITPNQMGPVRPMWFLDGSVQPVNGNPLRVSVSVGEPKESMAPIGLPIGLLSPDDKLIYRMANGDPQNRTAPYEGIEVMDAATGERKQMLPVPGGVIYMALSPDGKTLSVVCGKDAWRLSRMAVDGSGYREVAAGVSGAIGWTRDGRSILFGKQDNNSAVWRIMRIPADGGQAEFTGISTEVLQGFEFSPDGSKIVYSGSSYDQEVWALDNVLAALK